MIELPPTSRPSPVLPGQLTRPATAKRIGRRRFIGGIAGLTATLLGPRLADAQTTGNAELLMFDDPGCPWCRKWRAEVGPGYSNSAEGKRAPLRTIQLRGPMPGGLKLAGAVRATPTFVLVEGGREVGRITGYPGPDFFWSMLGDLMKKLKGTAPGDRA